MLSARRKLDQLVHELSPAMRQLQETLGSSSLACSMTAQQQALWWSFLLVMAQGNAREGVVAPRLQEQLEELSVAVLRSDKLAADIAQLRSVICRMSGDADLGGTRWRSLEQAGSLFPLVEMFERLLAAGDRDLRRRRGAYFTPFPLVRYMVRSVDTLLQRELHLPAGLRTEQERLCVVDPACGGGAFLLGVLEELSGGGAHGRGAATGWLSRHELVGVDVLPACCRAAELLVEQLLVDPRPEQAGGSAVWSAVCGSVLQDVTFSGRLFEHRIPVVIGNPPYNNFGRLNRGAWILGQLETYKRGLREKKLNLNDDFIKFIRWAQYWIDRAGRGIAALVTNNTYLSGLTHRTMRASLADSFDLIYVLDLHGSHKKREVTPAGVPDQNVFSIQQGVSIGLFIKTGTGRGRARLLHHDLWGSRTEKLQVLAEQQVDSMPWKTLEPREPGNFFVPRPRTDSAEYATWPRIDGIFRQYVSGVQTKLDRLFVGFDKGEVETRLSCFLERARAGDLAGDVPPWLRKRVAGVVFDPSCIRPYMVAPFDVRWIYYEPRLLGRARFRLLHGLEADNVALVFMRQTTNQPPYDHLFVTNMLVSDRVFYSAHGAPFAAPLYGCVPGRRTVNLHSEFLRQLSTRVGVADSALQPLDVLRWIYASLQDGDYRNRYYDSLRIDFPRVPWPRDGDHFRDLCQTGARLIERHLYGAGAQADHAAVDQPAVPFVVLRPGYPRWNAGRLELDPQLVWSETVPPAAWHARIGGYEVLPRWFRQRQGRTLTHVDRDHLSRMLLALGDAK